MINSGNRELDEILGGGYKEELSLIYGPGASGKTTLCLVLMCDMLKRGKKVVYIDTENGFSIERFMQLCGPGYLLMLDKLLILRVNNFEDQCKKINSLLNFVSIDLVILDSLGVYYRKEVRENPSEVNKKMDRQLRMLTQVARRKVPVVVTNQVSTHPDSGEIKLVGGDMVRKWGQCLIELSKDPRKLKLVKPLDREVLFEIINEGVKLLP